jgi:hypothetical protein
MRDQYITRPLPSRPRCVQVTQFGIRMFHPRFTQPGV